MSKLNKIANYLDVKYATFKEFREYPKESELERDSLDEGKYRGNYSDDEIEEREKRRRKIQEERDRIQDLRTEKMLRELGSKIKFRRDRISETTQSTTQGQPTAPISPEEENVKLRQRINELEKTVLDYKAKLNDAMNKLQGVEPEQKSRAQQARERFRESFNRVKFNF